ncbi:MAG: four helix bundle protein [Deltaproteobacteria bacterium]|nr:four helix bundle protein [Deltaproteobacteria bacterium]
MLEKFRTYQLAKSFYFRCRGLKMKGPCKDQFDRALLSILLNLAEGSGKITAKDKRRFYAIAFGSLREVQALLDLNGYEDELKSSDHLAASLYCLIHRAVA